MESLTNKLVIKESVCEIIGITKGCLYRICDIYRPYFKQSNEYGTNILCHAVYAVYIGVDTKNYYFKKVREDNCNLIFNGSPYELTVDDADIIISRNNITGCKFTGKGHNNYFDRYEYSQFIDTLYNEVPSNYKVITLWDSYYKPLWGETTESKWFNEKFLKNYSYIFFTNVLQGTTKQCNIEDVEINVDTLVDKLTGETLLTFDDLTCSMTVSRDCILYIVVGG